MILQGFGAAAQQQLAAAKVVVIGAGGLGCPALQYLAAAGVGTIGIVDDDVVSLSNLHRQVLYVTADVGLPKAERAASRLKALNSDIVIIPYQVRLQKENAFELICKYDFVIDGTDNFSSRYMINDACVLLRKPLVYGAVSQYEGQVALFNVGDENRATNYRDLFPNPPDAGDVPNCAEAGVLGVLPGIIGTMQAAETIKLITGIGTPLANKLLTYNVLHNTVYEVTIRPSTTGAALLPKSETDFLKTDYNNVACINEKDVIEIDANQFHALRNGSDTVAIDVREWGEQPLVTTFHHKQIPMSAFNERMEEIREETVLLFCQHGIRSLYAAELLQDHFGAAKNVYSLKGGLAKCGAELGVGKM